MGSFLVRILFHGLILFVPQTSAQTGGPAQLTALLVDGTTVPSNASGCVAAHHGFVSFTYDHANATSCVDSGCSMTSDNTMCVCPLAHFKNIRLDPMPNPQPQTQTPQDLRAGVSVLPANVAEAESPTYLLNINESHSELKLQDGLLTAPQPSNVLARMAVPYTTLHACSLAIVPGDGADMLRAFGLAPLGAMPAAPTRAAAQALIADTYVAAGASSQSVNLILDDSSGASRTFQLHPTTVLDCGATPCVEVVVTNERDSNTNSPAACNDGAGRDFAFMYKLFKNAPTWDASPLPTADPSASAIPSTSALMPTVCGSMTHGINSRPVCAMATVNPSS